MADMSALNTWSLFMVFMVFVVQIQVKNMNPQVNFPITAGMCGDMKNSDF